MNTKNNKRRRDSRRSIEKIFIDLLQTKELNQITVSDICQKAGLNRSTFYANYEDIYGLADSIRASLEDSLAELYREDITDGHNSNDYLRLFRHIRDNPLFYKTYFKLGYDNAYKIVQYDTALAEKHFGNRFIEYHCEFFKQGITAIIKKWLDNGCLETAEEMTEIIESEYWGRAESVR